MGRAVSDPIPGQIRVGQAVSLVARVDALRRIDRALNDRGFFVFVITNQAGVARRICTEAEVEALHCWINDELDSVGAHVDSFRFYPNHPLVGQGAIGASRGLKCSAAYFPSGQYAENRVFSLATRRAMLAAALGAGIIGHRFDGGNLRRFVDHVTADLSPWPADS